MRVCILEEFDWKWIIFEYSYDKEVLQMRKCTHTGNLFTTVVVNSSKYLTDDFNPLMSHKDMVIGKSKFKPSSIPVDSQVLD